MLSSGKYVARERLTALMDAAVDAILLIDIHGVVQDCNRAALAMFCGPRDDICGHNISQLMPEPYRHEHDGYIQHFLTTRNPTIIGIGRDVTARRLDGRLLPIHLTVGTVEHDETIIGFAGFIRDLTHEKAVEAELHERELEVDETRERLVHAGRLGTIGEMAAGIAHELNQPLTAISSYANACERLLSQPDIQPDLLRETLGKIRRQAERAGDVIKGLRRITRKQELAMQTVDLVEVIDELRPLLDIGSRIPNQNIQLALGHRPAVVMADPVQIQQVVLNLVRNAIDAMQEGGGSKVHVRLRSRSPQWWWLEVEDDGPGIPDHIREQLFHPFVTSKAEGVGLGLSICQSIAESHGGELDCAHSEPGCTVFRMLVPAVDIEGTEG